MNIKNFGVVEDPKGTPCSTMYNICPDEKKRMWFKSLSKKKLGWDKFIQAGENI